MALTKSTEDQNETYPRIVFRVASGAYPAMKLLADEHYRLSLIKKPSVDLLAKYALQEYAKNYMRQMKLKHTTQSETKFQSV
jgi:hypothetical protein